MSMEYHPCILHTARSQFGQVVMVVGFTRKLLKVVLGVRVPYGGKLVSELELMQGLLEVVMGVVVEVITMGLSRGATQAEVRGLLVR
jgi:hypothetical protein